MPSELWTKYAGPWSRKEPLSFNSRALERQLEDQAKRVFSKEDTHIVVTDISRSAVTSQTFRTPNTFSKSLQGDQSEATGIKIISIYSSSTIEPLQITLENTIRLMHRYDVHPGFFSIILSFGEQPHHAESSDYNFAEHSSDPKLISISYQVNYFEENHRGGNNPWSFRHTGVYHQHGKNSDLFVILHPNEHPVFEQRLQALVDVQASNNEKETELTGPQERAFPTNILDLCAHPHLLHVLVISSVIDNFRWYLRFISDQWDDENDKALVVRPDKATAELSFMRIKKLRNINDLVLRAKACCAGNLDLVKSLNKNMKDLDLTHQLESFEYKLHGYVKSSGALIPRIGSTMDLVGYTLTLHNQLETVKVDKEVRNLTQDLRDVTEKLKILTESTVDDSATVKIITIVSAFYLPGSFVASVYGMNFFVFDGQSRSIEIGSDFWIFIVTWLPLTMITAVIYALVVWNSARKKGKKRVMNF